METFGLSDILTLLFSWSPNFLLVSHLCQYKDCCAKAKLENDNININNAVKIWFFIMKLLRHGVI